MSQDTIDPDPQGDTYYDLIGVAPDVNTKQISRACKVCQKRFHPDGSNLDTETANKAFSRLQDAEEILTNVEKRSAYDQFLTEWGPNQGHQEFETWIQRGRPCPPDEWEAKSQTTGSRRTDSTGSRSDQNSSRNSQQSQGRQNQNGSRTGSSTSHQSKSRRENGARDVFTLQELQTMDPFDFEHLIGDLWGAKGYRTEVKQESGDKGIDVVAEDPETNETIVIQAKRYTKGNTVGSPEVQQYGALKLQEPYPDRVIIVTTSSYSTQARELAQEIGIELIDGEQLVNELNSHQSSSEFHSATQTPQWVYNHIANKIPKRSVAAIAAGILAITVNATGSSLVFLAVHGIATLSVMGILGNRQGISTNFWVMFGVWVAGLISFSGDPSGNIPVILSSIALFYPPLIGLLLSGVYKGTVDPFIEHGIRARRQASKLAFEWMSLLSLVRIVAAIIIIGSFVLMYVESASEGGISLLTGETLLVVYGLGSIIIYLSFAVSSEGKSTLKSGFAIFGIPICGFALTDVILPVVPEIYEILLFIPFIFVMLYPALIGLWSISTVKKKNFIHIYKKFV